MLKVVLDTSVIVAGGLSQGKSHPCAQILNLWRKGEFTLVTAPELLRELRVVLLRRGHAQEQVDSLIKLILSVSFNIPGACIATKLDNIDPNDNMFLAAAYEARADYLISLDREHILPWKYYHGTQIVTPEVFLIGWEEAQKGNQGRLDEANIRFSDLPSDIQANNEIINNE